MRSVVGVVVGDDDEACIGALEHGLEEIAEALDIVIVERGVDLVEHADGRRIGQKHREDQGHGGERLLAAGEQR